MCWMEEIGLAFNLFCVIKLVLFYTTKQFIKKPVLSLVSCFMLSILCLIYKLPFRKNKSILHVESKFLFLPCEMLLILKALIPFKHTINVLVEIRF